MKNKILLYNPKAVFFDMPLALLAIGSALDANTYEVIIVDGRIEPKPLETLKDHLPEALCLGITVLTGNPIKDALEKTRNLLTFLLLRIIYNLTYRNHIKGDSFLKSSF